MRNIEFKAELRDLALARSIARALGAAYVTTMEQTDTYFRVARGRLKRRECPGEPVEYIFYERAAVAGPRPSDYQVLTEDRARERFGTRPLPVWLTVRKVRELYMIANVRIHLDTVEGLGTFLEFEAVVSDAHGPDGCTRAVQDLRDRFGPALGEAVASSYSDLLEAERDPGGA